MNWDVIVSWVDDDWLVVCYGLIKQQLQSISNRNYVSHLIKAVLSIFQNIVCPSKRIAVASPTIPPSAITYAAATYRITQPSAVLAVAIIIRLDQIDCPSMSFLKNSTQHKTYCFNHRNNIMFFQYNSNHPILMKNLKFELAKIKIFTHDTKLYSCLITSNPHLNLVLNWNEQYFAKLFHGLAFFELEQSPDQDDDSVSLVVRDQFEQNEQIFLLRAKLNEQFGYDLTNQLWNTFAKFNSQKQMSIQTMLQDNIEYRKKADHQLTLLMQLQQQKQLQKTKLKGQLSALLRQKQAKLREYNQLFEYHNYGKQSQPSVDLSQQKESMSMAGSLFQQSQDLNYFRT